MAAENTPIQIQIRIQDSDAKLATSLPSSSPASAKPMPRAGSSTLLPPPNTRRRSSTTPCSVATSPWASRATARGRRAPPRHARVRLLRARPVHVPPRRHGLRARPPDLGLGRRGLWDRCFRPPGGHCAHREACRGRGHGRRVQGVGRNAAPGRRGVGRRYWWVCASGAPGRGCGAVWHDEVCRWSVCVADRGDACELGFRLCRVQFLEGSLYDACALWLSLAFSAQPLRFQCSPRDVCRVGLFE
jgi:hypothetical protein